MNYYTLISYLAVVCLLFVFGRFFIKPLRFFLKLLSNSMLSALLLVVVNFIGNYFSFHIGLNIFTILFVSILGIPGVTLLSLVHLLI